MKKFIAVLLCIAMLFAGSAVAVSAESTAEQSYSSVMDYVSACSSTANTPAVAQETEENTEVSINNSPAIQFKRIFAKVLNWLSNLFINDVVGTALNLIVPDSPAVKDYEDFNIEEYGNFYAGMDEFLDEPADNAVWSLGYGSASIMPFDFGEKAYAKGAYMPYYFGNEMHGEEELRVRAVVLDDNSGRGKVVFAVVDAMGICNDDVRTIRAALAQLAKEYNVVSINISATHIHSGIDSQGVWTDPVGVLFNNVTAIKDEDVKYGVDRTFLQAMVDGTKEAVEEALKSMTKGKLYYSTTDISDYVWDRTAPISIDENLYKLEFIPTKATATPTIIASFGCHPESASYDWQEDDKFSADFVWSMEEVMNAAGYNFIYIQGQVCTATSSRGLSNDGVDTNAHSTAVRYGYELGYITLTMSNTTAERIRINNATGDKLGVKEYADKEEYADYTVWYEDLETVEKVDVEPLLNITMEQFPIKIENNIVALLGKTSIADNLVLKDDFFGYYTVTEVGYMEIGDVLKVYISPGETFGELLDGGKGIEGFPYDSIRETVGENTIVFDLMNDAAGYVANDANFVLAGLQYNEADDVFDSDTWCLISYGKHTASTLLSHFYGLVEANS